jgi:hypothetical protein
MSTPDEQTNAYRASHERIDVLVRRLDVEQLATVVTCCPLRSVKDLIGHLTGVLEDRRDGNMPTGSFGEWTAAQVARHRDEPIGSIWSGWGSDPTLVLNSLYSDGFFVLQPVDVAEVEGF